MSLKIPSNKPHVFVNAFARLHMGFFDLSGQADRQFGSLGLGLNAPDTLLELAVGENVFNQVEEEYVLRSKKAILADINIEQEVSIYVHRQIPRHFGLGSGTQMALAIGAGINKIFGLKLTLDEIAHITNRGKRSGIGIGTFENGGLVLDGGRCEETIVPPVIAQHAFPEQWRVLLIFDHQHIGVHGEEETKAFSSLAGADLHQTQQISQQVLMQALPALKEHDLKTFGQAIASLQAYTGDYFAPVQGGRFSSKLVSQTLNYLIEEGILCVGQSSWGPTGFAIFESESVANEYMGQLKSTFKADSLSWLLCEARNVGAIVNGGIKA